MEAAQEYFSPGRTTAVTRLTSEWGLKRFARRMRVDLRMSGWPRWTWTMPGARPASSSKVTGLSSPGRSRVSRPATASCQERARSGTAKTFASVSSEPISSRVGWWVMRSASSTTRLPASGVRCMAILRSS